jgi:hypothetical protein
MSNKKRLGWGISGYGLAMITGLVWIVAICLALGVK